MEMNVIFEIGEEVAFSIAVHPFDTIRDVKKKIQNILEIPISQQIFILDGQFLEDHLHVLSTSIHPGSRILFSLQPNAQNIAPLPPPPPLRKPMLPSWPQPTLYHPLELIMQPMPPTTPLVPMLPRNQMVPMPASTPLLQLPTITPPFHAPESTPVVQVPARALMVQAPMRTLRVQTPARTLAVEVPASTTLAQATERSPVALMPQCNPVVGMRAGSPVLPVRHMQSNVELEESVPNTEKEASAARFPVLPMEHMRSDIELKESVASTEKEESAALKRRKVTVKVKIVDCGGDRIPIETEWDGTVLMLKEKIVEHLKICGAGFDTEDVTVERMVLQSHLRHAELFDYELLKDCLFSENPEIDLFLETVSSSGCRE